MAEEIFSTETVKYTVTVAGGMSMAKEQVENEVTINDIKRIAAKYGIKEFKISASVADTGMMRPLGANNLPFKGDVLLQEYNAPKTDVFSSVPAVYTVTVAGGMSMAKEQVENEVTIDDIKRIAAKYGIKEFKISASVADTGMMRPLGANNLPFKGDVLLQEYNAPKYISPPHEIFISGRDVTVHVNGEITLNAVKEVAYRYEIKEFELSTGGGYPLTESQFPVHCDVVITEYIPPADDVFTSRHIFTTEGFVPESSIATPEPVQREGVGAVDDVRDETFENDDDDDDDDEDDDDDDDEDDDDDDDDEDDEDEDEDEEEDENEVPVRDQVFVSEGSFIFSSARERYTIIVAGVKQAAMEQVDGEITVQILKTVAARYGIKTFTIFAQSTTTGPMCALRVSDFPVRSDVVMREQI